VSYKIKTPRVALYVCTFFKTRTFSYTLKNALAYYNASVKRIVGKGLDLLQDPILPILNVLVQYWPCKRLEYFKPAKSCFKHAALGKLTTQSLA
jgi:hypothetical protein